MIKHKTSIKDQTYLKLCLCAFVYLSVYLPIYIYKKCLYLVVHCFSGYTHRLISLL
jgi:hypothetical protein